MNSADTRDYRLLNQHLLHIEEQADTNIKYAQLLSRLLAIAQEKTQIRPRAIYTLLTRIVDRLTYQEIADNYGYANAHTAKNTANRTLRRLRPLVSEAKNRGRKVATKPPLVYRTPDTHQFFAETFRLSDKINPNQHQLNNYTPTGICDIERQGAVDNQVRPCVSVCCIPGEIIPDYRKLVLPWIEKIDGGKVPMAILNETTAIHDRDMDVGIDRQNFIRRIDQYYRQRITGEIDADTAQRLLGIAKKRVGNRNQDYGETVEMLFLGAMEAIALQTLKGMTPTPSFIAQAADYSLKTYLGKLRKSRQKRKIASLINRILPIGGNHGDQILTRFWSGSESACMEYSDPTKTRLIKYDHNHLETICRRWEQPQREDYEGCGLGKETPFWPPRRPNS